MKLIDTIFKLFTHPLLMPVYFLLVLFVAFDFFSINGRGLTSLLFFVFVSVSLLPGISLYIAGRTKLLSDPFDPVGNDKKIAFLLLSLFSIFVFKLWHDKHPDVLYLYVFATITIIYLFLFLSYFIFELDWYMIFWGALLGFYLILLQLGAAFSITTLSAIVIVAALSAVSRSLPIQIKHANGRLFGGYIAGVALAIIIGRVMIF